MKVAEYAALNNDNIIICGDWNLVITPDLDTNHTIWRVGASTTLPLRFCYQPTTTMKIRLRLVYADGDAATT